MSRAAVIVSAGTVLLVTAVLSRGAERRAPCPGSLVPAYVDPEALARIAAAAEPPRLLVLNPASGPGAQPQPAYWRVVAAAQAAGTRVLGYVPTAYGARPAAAVEADARRYAAWYEADGVFLDETAHDDARLPYYAALVRRLRDGGAAPVVLNPGTVPARGYFAVADVVVTFEGPAADYRRRLARMPAWIHEIPPQRMAHLLYAASGEEALAALRAPSGAGYVYATPGTPPDPWRTVPALADRPGGCR